MKIRNNILMSGVDGGAGSPPAGSPPAGSPPAGSPPAGSPQPHWFTGLPADMQANPALSTFKDQGVDTLVKSYLSAQSLIGAKRIALPGEKATPEELSAFYSAIGRPESIEKYSPSEVKLAEGVVMDNSQIDGAKKLFFDLGLSDKQQKGVMDYYFNSVNSMHKSLADTVAQSKVQGETALRTKWGANYDANVAVAKQVLSKYITEDAASELTGPLGNNPALVEMFYNMGKAIMEDTSPTRKSLFEVNTPAAAQQKLGQLKTDKDFMAALDDAQHPGHKDAVLLWHDLHKQATVNNTQITAS